MNGSRLSFRDSSVGPVGVVVVTVGAVVVVVVVPVGPPLMSASPMHAGTFLYDAAAYLAVLADYLVVPLGILDFNLVGVTDGVVCWKLEVANEPIDSARFFF